MARRIEYDPQQVLKNAMQVFWRKGYCATSMADLVDATHLNPGSLYGAFHSKDQLFLRTLDEYGARAAERIAYALSEPSSPLAAIKSYFFQLAEDSAKATGRKGCFLVNSALERAHRDKAVQARVKHHFETIEGLLREALARAQAAGEIPKEKDCSALASFMISTIWGLRVMSRTRPTADRTRSVIEQMLRLLE
jgi:TetR/AcrR family transcriptional regulator, transcriptional repressor for nem operon